jgi:large subunit ribosomal protein L22
MATAKAIIKYVRVSPKKARYVAGLIRGKNVEQALQQLQAIQSKGSRMLKKTLQSAVANAENNLEAKKSDLKIKHVMIDGGPTFKRGKSRAKGGIVPVIKRTSHFTVIVGTE